MKINYDKKTDFLEFFTEKIDFYEDESDSLNYYTYKSEEDDQCIGYGILNARANLPLFDKVSINTKIALLSWLIRKRNNISQAELANILNVSISTIKRVEEGITTSPTVEYLRGLKQLDPKIDLNIVFERVTDISA